MSAPVQNPPTPHLQPIPGGFYPGCIAHVTGTLTPGAASLIVKLQSGSNGDPSDDIGLCVYGRVREGQMGRNSFTRGLGWGTEELSSSVPGLAPGAPFDLTVLCDPQHFKMAFNGHHLCEFNHRVNPSSLTYLQVASLPGDLSLSCVWIEQNVAPPQQQVQSYGAPPPAYSAAAPSSMPYNPNPVAGYAPPPGMQQPPMMYPQQQQYGQQQPFGQQPYGQQPYGQQPPQQYPNQYSPHHQGHGKQKGLMGMVAGAAGAVGATGLLNKATKVIGGGSHNHGGGGYPSSGGAYPGSGGGHPPGAYGSGYPQGGGGGPW